MNVYLTDITAFLPNEPVANEAIEQILGSTDSVPSALKEKILQKSHIHQRYYALHPVTQTRTHSNAQLTAAAIRQLSPYPGFTVQEMACLCCGTSTPDQWMPGHGAMVHAELGQGAYEVVQTAGTALAGVTSLKYAAMNVALGLTNHAVATGSELFSSCVQAAFLAHTNLPFEIEFLRWIVGDAAGAIWLAPQPAPDRLSLRIDRIEIVSFASESETCMYAGAVKEPDGSLQGWRAFASLHAAVEGQAFAIKQDLSLFLQGLNRIDHSLTSFCRTAHLDPTEITWFLPCYPSDHCRPPLSHRLQEMGFAIPQERWWTSFEKTGYTGAASLYVVLAELYHSGQLQPQDRIFCFVPESGRFSVSYLLLTVI